MEYLYRTKIKKSEISEKATETINNLIEINNDRVEGFEKAAADLQEQDYGLTAVFNKLAGESRENATELSASCSIPEASVEGTSTFGVLHVPGSRLKPLPAASRKRFWMNANVTF